MTNGDGMTLNGTGAIVNRVMQWTALAGVFLYVLNIGSWVGAAEEKFKAAETVEQKQEQIKEDVTIILAEQAHIKEDVGTLNKKLDDMEDKMEKDKDEILEAIRESQ